jgi:hypothetical protein
VPSANQTILDEVNQARLWFRAKKTRAIWAKRLDRDERVETLEGVEQVPAGTWLCRGEAGELWPQTEQRLHDKYIATEEVDEAGWRKYEPHPDTQGAMAAQVNHPFRVEAQWGTLTGKPGDYLVKNYEDRDVLYPEDVWIVDQKLFQATYAATEMKQPKQKPR